MMFQLIKNSDLEKLPRYEQYATVAGDTFGHLVIIPRPQCKAVCEKLSKDYAHFRVAPFTDALNKAQYIFFNEVSLNMVDVPSLSGNGERVSINSALGLNTTQTNRTILQAIKDFSTPISLVYKVPDFTYIPEKPSELADQVVAAKGLIQDQNFTTSDVSAIGAVNSGMVGSKQWSVIAQMVSSSSVEVKTFFEQAYKWEEAALSAFQQALGLGKKK
jgi:hypothetical protein